MLSRLDAAIGRRSNRLQLAFRVTAGALVAIGMFAWLGVWFQRSFWFGVIQAVILVDILFMELRKGE